MEHVSLAALWLPILLSAVIVFVVSSIIHMALPIHKNDYRKLPDEDNVADALRSAGVTPGRMYILPHCDHKNMKSPEVVEKFKRGPVGLITIRPNGAPSMAIFSAVVLVLPGRGNFRRLFNQPHTAGRNRVSGGFSRRRNHSVLRIFARVDSKRDLEGRDLGCDIQARS